jgi:hypothetical protein
LKNDMAKFLVSGFEFRVSRFEFHVSGCGSKLRRVPPSPSDL